MPMAARPGPEMRQALVFGGSGQIGAPLLDRLHHDGWTIHAVSRSGQAPRPGVHWLRGDLAHVEGLPAAVDAIFSCGPLDHFGRWYATTPVCAPRIVAFGSTSIAVKSHSADAGERDLARRLAQGERTVFDTAAARDAGATLLRPTLVYGAGRDRSLSRIARLAARWGRFPLPRDARGLRQPVHVDDLAAAALACVDAGASHGRAYALPGGETLPYREMVARVLDALSPPPRLVELPAPVFALAMSGARILGRAQGFSRAAAIRLREDLVFDASPACTDFGYAARAFHPDAGMLGIDVFRAR